MNDCFIYPTEKRIVAGYDIGTIKNREESLEIVKNKFGFRSGFHLNQIHSGKVVICDHQTETQDGDAIICYEKNILLGIFTADCVPVTVYSEEGIGIIHAGWKGFVNNIFHNFFNIFNASQKNIKAIIGPCICSNCYEVGIEVTSQFSSDCIFKKNDSLFLDLKKATELRLIENGVKKEDIKTSEECTLCGPSRFHSYRRDKTEFRNIHYIGMV